MESVSESVKKSATEPNPTAAPERRSFSQRARRRLWRHKWRGVGVLILPWIVVFISVSCASSPTDLQTTAADGAKLAYLQHDLSGAVHDERGAVIFVHGAPANATSWRLLLKRHRDELPFSLVQVVDRAGYGNSPGQDLTLAGQAARIEPLLVPTNDQLPIIVGHSYGGPVALRLAVDYPERVGGVVLVAGACDAYMKDSQWFRRLADFISFIVPKPWAIANRELLALTDENRAMESLLEQVTCPVMVVHGEWDPVCPHDSTVAYLQRALPNAQRVRVVSIPRTGHNLHLSHPEIIVETLRRLADPE